MRLARSREDLFGPLARLYGDLPEYARFADDLIGVLAEGWAARPADLRRLDLQRDLEPDWFLRPRRWSATSSTSTASTARLSGVLDQLDYLDELGVTYVHFMPCLQAAPRRQRRRLLGHGLPRRSIRASARWTDFETVARALRARGISLCVDLVLNHTAKEHEWAEKARAGDREVSGLLPDVRRPTRCPTATRRR